MLLNLRLRLLQPNLYIKRCNHTYDFKKIESKWSSKWKQNITKKQDLKDNFYILSMFPYPSGNLHMGHVRVYTISDMLARFYRLKGYDVLHPMGWDAFGLPAENAALERNVSAAEWTETNIKSMKGQFNLIHADLDWDKEINTSSEEYYKHTQSLILKLYEKGLLYRKKSQVHWDPVDQTVLANEQVDNEGKSWRSGAIVEKKWLEQWYVKITDYSEVLLKDLEKLTEWPDKVKLMQNNWIGKAEGCAIDFKLKDGITDKIDKIQVFTTRAETIDAVTFIGVSTEHPILKYMQPNLKQQLKIIENTKYDEIKGFDTGLKVIHPISNIELPIYVVSYVLNSYKSGAVMGVPAHDKRDFQLANNDDILKHNIKSVIKCNEDELPYTKVEGIIKEGEYKDMDVLEARKKIIERIGKKDIGYKLNDWLISRQRYWGAPMPFIHCNTCGIQPVDKKDLPITLKKQRKDFNVNNSNSTTCPKCNSIAKYDIDTMDTFVDSSWYYLRFLDTKNKDDLVDINKLKKWMPVDLYIGGIEHAILHLLYSRFIYKFLLDYYKLDIQFNEPFKKLLTQGMVQGQTYKLNNGQFVKPDKVDLTNPNLPLHKDTKQSLTISYEKMSKSKYNGVDPKSMVDKYGVDATRLYMLFKAPPQDNLNWEETSIVGMQRFLQRIFNLISNLNNNIINNSDPNSEQQLKYQVNSTINSIQSSLSNDFKFNTCVSDLIKLLQYLEKYPYKQSQLFINSLQKFIVLLAPFAPSSVEEYYSILNQKVNITSKDSVFLESWPKVEQDNLILNNIPFVLQINGKKKAMVDIQQDWKDDEIIQYIIDFINKDSKLNNLIKNGIKKQIIVRRAKLINLII